MMNSSAKPNIFITGGTGYIAGSLLHLMMLRNYPREFRISALVRRLCEDAEKMRNLGIEPVMGSLDDYELIRNEAAHADVVFNTANCDHQDSARAIIRGLSERSKETSRRPILIHTSGAGLLSTNSVVLAPKRLGADGRQSGH